MSSYIKIVGKIKTASEITGIEDAIDFRGVDSKGEYVYNKKLNSLKDLIVKLSPLQNNDPYDYLVEETGGIKVKKEWVKELSYSVEWDRVPIDEVIEVSNNGSNWFKMHFAGYFPDDPNGKPYFTFQAGRSSKTALSLREVISITLTDWTNLGGKYFLLYSKNKTFYVWFNLNNTSVDPGSSSGPLSNSGFEGVRVDIQTGAPASFIANTLANVINQTQDFTAVVTPLNNNVVEITVKDEGMVYDASPGTSNLNINVKVQGGDTTSWSMARPLLP